VKQESKLLPAKIELNGYFIIEKNAYILVYFWLSNVKYIPVSD